MVNGVFDFGPATLDLALQGGDARLQFIDGQMIDILPDELIHRIVGALREKIVGLHGYKVDRGGPHVNKTFVYEARRGEKRGTEWPKFPTG